MKREVSTSTIGHDEEKRKPLLAAYMLQRRILLGCCFLMVLSLIIWIVAIATDHWIIISGGGGIFIPETRRFFMYSHSGLWRHCRFTVSPQALTTSDVLRNFTSVAYTAPNSIYDAKGKAAKIPALNAFRDLEPDILTVNFTENAKRRMFISWLRSEEKVFQELRRDFDRLVLSSPSVRRRLIPADKAPNKVDPLVVKGEKARETFGKSLKELKHEGTAHYFVIPEPVQMAIFDGWESEMIVLRLLWPFARDIGLPAYVLDEHGVIQLLVPPSPPKRHRTSNGYEYIENRRCNYIDMFPNANSLRNEPGFDDTLMDVVPQDYIRTQASFACITVFVMGLGAVFSFYTFVNPRYMFKRLAGGIHLVAASTALVVLQVLLSSIEYTKKHLVYAYPAEAELKYGYGIYFAWFTFITNILCGLMFMWYSGKKKGAKAPTDEIAMADEPTIMGR